MDLAKWWNTAWPTSAASAPMPHPPGFPTERTIFPQARSVFAVAAYRCREVFDHA